MTDFEHGGAPAAIVPQKSSTLLAEDHRRHQDNRSQLGRFQEGTTAMPKILLVEDDETNRDMLSRRLIKRGYEVTIAGDGSEACRLADSQPFDLILMDVMLPLLDGFAATRIIKQQESTRDIPIIALTALAMSGDRERAIAAGCDDYDTKPIDFKRLTDKIQTMLAGKKVS